jgi:hypothetical protein
MVGAAVVTGTMVTNSGSPTAPFSATSAPATPNARRPSKIEKPTLLRECVGRRGQSNRACVGLRG